MSDQEQAEDLEVQLEIEEEGQDDAPEIVKPEEGVDELKRQLDAERARRVDAERKAHEAG